MKSLDTTHTPALPTFVSRYVASITKDPITAQNILVIQELLVEIMEAGMIDSLEKKLIEHGEAGFIAAYNSLIHACNILLGKSSSDKRSITLLSDQFTERVAFCIV